MTSLARLPRSLHFPHRVPHRVPHRAPVSAQACLHVRNPAFSTSVYLDKQPTPTTTQKPGQPGNPELLRVTLDNLGISKNVRIVLFTLLGIWGTVETYFYYRAIMRWWKSGENTDGVEPD